MIVKNDCVRLANRLIVQFELDRDPISSVIEIDGEFIWLIIESVFKTSLLPKWQHMDCLNETEEFQFILQTLEQIFDLDLVGVNAAYLTMRKPEYVYLVLNALSLASDYVQSKGKNEDDSGGLTDQSSSEEVSSIVSSDLSNLSIDSSDESSNSSGSRKNKETIQETIQGTIQGTFQGTIQRSTKGTGRVKEVTFKDEDKSETSSFTDEEDILKVSKKESLPDKLSKRMPKNLENSELEPSSKSKKSFTDDELTNKLKELKDGKKLIQSLCHKKEQNFALQISFKILETLKIQERTKKIKSNLNRMHAYAPELAEQSSGLLLQSGQQYFHSPIRPTKPIQTNPKITRRVSTLRTASTLKTTALIKKRQPVRQPVRKAATKKKAKSLDLNAILDKLTGLSANQLNELKAKSDHQKQLADRVKGDLVEVERRLQSEMITRIERENRLLEMLQKDLDVDLKLSSAARDRLERKQLAHAKYDLRKERADLKRSTDDLHRSNWSTLKNLEAEQDRLLRELSRREERELREQVQLVKREIRECETKMREDQRQLLDNYDHFYLSQSTMIRQEIARRTGECRESKASSDSVQFNSVSLSRHLQRSYISQLYPKV